MNDKDKKDSCLYGMVVNGVFYGLDQYDRDFIEGLILMKHHMPESSEKRD